MTEAAQLAAIKRYTMKVLENDQTGHSMDHIERVVTMAKHLATAESCNQFLVEAAAYLHDVLDDKLVADVVLARQELIVFLQRIGVTTQDSQTVIYIVDHVSFSQSLDSPTSELTLEAQIVQDADRLDAIGAIGIARTFYFGGHVGHNMYDPTILPRELKSKAEYRVNETVINHFYEKLLKVPALLNRPLAKKIGQEREVVMLAFLAAFKKEWQGE